MTYYKFNRGIMTHCTEDIERLTGLVIKQSQRLTKLEEKVAEFMKIVEADLQEKNECKHFKE